MLYYFRYLLLSDNLDGKDTETAGCYNDWNRKEELPEIYKQTNARITIPSDADTFERAKAIAQYLREHAHGGPGLSRSSQTALRRMLEGKDGVCSDYSQVFNNFCVLNDIKVREWNCVDRFYKARFGHTFNEVYSQALGKWVMIDVHQAFFMTDENDNKLSVVECFKRLRAGRSNRFSFYMPAYWTRDLERLNNIYASFTIPYLTVNYRNKVVDRYLDKLSGKLPVFLITTLMILRGDNFRFLFVMDDYKEKLKPFQSQAVAAN